MVEYLRALKYPVISTIVIDIVFVHISYAACVLNMLTSQVLGLWHWLLGHGRVIESLSSKGTMLML